MNARSFLFFILNWLFCTWHTSSGFGLCRVVCSVRFVLHSIPLQPNGTQHTTQTNPHHQGIINHRLWEERKNEVNRREKVREKKWRTLFSSFHFSFFQFNSLCEECFVSFSFIQQNKACVILTFVCSWMKRKEQNHQSHNRDSHHIQVSDLNLCPISTVIL